MRVRWKLTGRERRKRRSGGDGVGGQYTSTAGAGPTAADGSRRDIGPARVAAKRLRDSHGPARYVHVCATFSFPMTSLPSAAPDTTPVTPDPGLLAAVAERAREVWA